MLATMIAGIVGGIDVIELERRQAVDLHDGFAASHGVVVHVGVEKGERAGREGAHFVDFELVAHAELEGAGDDGNVLAERMEVRSDTVSVGHLQADGVLTAGGSGVTFQNRELRAGIEERRNWAEGDLVGCKRVPGWGGLIDGGTGVARSEVDHTTKQSCDCKSKVQNAFHLFRNPPLN